MINLGSYITRIVISHANQRPNVLHQCISSSNYVYYLCLTILKTKHFCGLASLIRWCHLLSSQRHLGPCDPERPWLFAAKPCRARIVPWHVLSPGPSTSSGSGSACPMRRAYSGRCMFLSRRFGPQMSGPCAGCCLRNFQVKSPSSWLLHPTIIFFHTQVQTVCHKKPSTPGELSHVFDLLFPGPLFFTSWYLEFTPSLRGTGCLHLMPQALQGAFHLRHLLLQPSDLPGVTEPVAWSSWRRGLPTTPTHDQVAPVKRPTLATKLNISKNCSGMLMVFEEPIASAGLSQIPKMHDRSSLN